MENKCKSCNQTETIDELLKLIELLAANRSEATLHHVDQTLTHLRTHGKLKEPHATSQPPRTPS